MINACFKRDTGAFDKYYEMLKSVSAEKKEHFLFADIFLAF